MPLLFSLASRSLSDILDRGPQVAKEGQELEWGLATPCFYPAWPMAGPARRTWRNLSIRWKSCWRLPLQAPGHHSTAKLARWLFDVDARNGVKLQPPPTFNPSTHFLGIPSGSIHPHTHLTWPTFSSRAEMASSSWAVRRSQGQTFAIKTVSLLGRSAQGWETPLLTTATSHRNPGHCKCCQELLRP